jgi:hypothetical protein
VGQFCDNLRNNVLTKQLRVDWLNAKELFDAHDTQGTNNTKFFPLVNTF